MKNGSGWSLARLCACILLALPAVVVAEVDLSDFDDDVMRDMDDAYKDLEPVLRASNADIAKTDIATIRQSYQWAVEYFTAKKAEAPDALDIAAAGQKILADTESALNARNFDGAVEKARELQSNCKSCHEKYKPKKQ